MHDRRAAAALFDADARSRILDETRLPLRVPPNKLGLFWTDVGHACREYATQAQREASKTVSSERWRTAIAAGEKFRNESKRIMDEMGEEADPLIVRCHAFFDAFVERYREVVDLRFRLGITKPRSGAGQVLIMHMGPIYFRAFGREPSETPEGPFARFVGACLRETKGVKPISGAWVQKQVRRHKRKSKRSPHSFPSLSPAKLRFPWDDTAAESPEASHSVMRPQGVSPPLSTGTATNKDEQSPDSRKQS